MGTAVLEAEGLIKSYGHVEALRGASLKLYPGEVVALVGDNGAGKSTLMKVLSGAVRPDRGVIRIGGVEVGSDPAYKAQDHGIDTVYQDLALAPDLTLSENIFLGRERVRGGLLGALGMLDRGGMRAAAAAALSQLSVKMPGPGTPIGTLSGGQKQAVAISRSVMWADRGVFMDEPTAALGARQTEIVCDTIRDCAERGLGVLVISHDLPRMLTLAHRFLIMRHGQVAANLTAAEATMPRILGAMLGEDVPTEAWRSTTGDQQLDADEEEER
ncbi:ATP-binding cassette domain-containing protein [Leifsonia sp. C5G2]|uniref:ATP-binding cassette domain-containing protein n=1 Tax=Leifsonia sp. C5G2 TaxID=2735269 RepID=UPI0018154511|nr:sugar ABC transporter ATP-binding protein [Leifsonia sp. C5G2]